MSFGSTIVVNKFCYLMMSSTENCVCPNFFPSKKTQNGIIVIEKDTLRQNIKSCPMYHFA